MSPIQQMLLGAGAGAKKIYIDDLLSSYIYVGENFEFNAITSDQVVSSSEIINKQRDFRVELRPNYMDMFDVVI